MTLEKREEMTPKNMQIGNLIDDYMVSKGFTGEDFVKLLVDGDEAAFQKHHIDAMDSIFNFLVEAENPLAAIDKIRNDAITQITGTFSLACRLPITFWNWRWDMTELEIRLYEVNVGLYNKNYLVFTDSFLDAFAANLSQFCYKHHLPGYAIIVNGIHKKEGWM